MLGENKRKWKRLIAWLLVLVILLSQAGTGQTVFADDIVLKSSELAEDETADSIEDEITNSIEDEITDSIEDEEAVASETKGPLVEDECEVPEVFLEEEVITEDADPADQQLEPGTEVLNTRGSSLQPSCNCSEAQRNVQLKFRGENGYSLWEKVCRIHPINPPNPGLSASGAPFKRWLTATSSYTPNGVANFSSPLGSGGASTRYFAADYVKWWQPTCDHLNLPYPGHVYFFTPLNGIVNDSTWQGYGDLRICAAEVFIPPTPPAIPGYRLIGWSPAQDSNSLYDFNIRPLDNPAAPYYPGSSTSPTMNLYARYKILYTVSFDSRGGSYAAPVQHISGERVTRPADPVRQHYNFTGWYKEAACVNPWNFAEGMPGRNMTLYAGWSPKIYQVNFNSQGGSGVGSVSASYGSKIGTPVAPNRTHYTFGGWYKEASCVNPWNFSSDVVSQPVVTLYAKWNPVSYQVTFNSQLGTAVPPKSVVYNSTMTAPAAPTRTGYDFGGWYKESTCVNAWNFGSDRVVGNIVLYAKWTAKIYQVTYNSQGGSSVSAQNAAYGTKLTAPAEPTRTGYTFGGWYKESNCVNAWQFASNTVAGNTILYAKWTAIVYNVSFNSQGGSPVASERVAYGSLVPQPIPPSRFGYQFAGWYQESSCVNLWNFTLNVVTGSRTLFAKWELKTYEVTFDTRGGSPNTITETVNEGALLSPPQEPTRSGYVFDGWYKNTGYTQKWNFASDTVLETTTLYAKWAKILTFTLDAGAGYIGTPGSTNRTIQAVEGYALDRSLLPPDSDLNHPGGYAFEGWYKDQSCQEPWIFTGDTGTADIAAEDTTLYARWRGSRHDITWDSQGGNEGIIQRNYAYPDGEPITELDIPAVTHPNGYRFVGWYKESNCITAWNMDDPVVADMTLYARWEIREPLVFLEIPASLELTEYEQEGYAVQTGQISVRQDPTNEAWYPQGEVKISTNPMFLINLTGSGDTFQVNVFDENGNSYDGNGPLMVLEPRGNNRTGSFTVKTAVDHDKDVGEYQGIMAFTMELEGGLLP